MFLRDSIYLVSTIKKKPFKTLLIRFLIPPDTLHNIKVINHPISFLIVWAILSAIQKYFVNLMLGSLNSLNPCQDDLGKN